jgi:lysophospholipase L1-like esterase
MKSSVARRPLRQAVRRSLTLVSVAVCAMAAVAAPAAAAKGKRSAGPPRVTAGSTYLALGDSVTFGYMEPGVVPTPDYHNAASFLAYPEQLGAELHLNVVNAACPGETSASLIDASAPSLGCENAHRRADPLHVSYSGSQLAYAVKFVRHHHNVRLVSLMIGANDLFLCEGSGSGCTTNSALGTIAANTRLILSAIRSKGGYRGQLALVNYYSLGYGSAATTASSVKLNQAMDNSARRFHAVIANGFGELQAAALHSGGNSCTAGLLTQVGAGECGIHPSYAGQALLAQAPLKVIKL